MGNNVIYADDPEALTVSFQRHRLIAKNVEAVAVEGLGDDIGAVRVIVIA